MKIRKLLLWVCMWMWLSSAASAQIPSPAADFYIYDGAHVLKQQTEAHIVFCNDALYAACGAQIAVVTVDTTGDMAVDAYALELFNQWGIGDAQKNNGFLVLLAIRDENYYALPGSGLDTELSGGAIKLLLDKYLEPAFARGAYDLGVHRLFDVLFEKIAAVCAADVTLADGDALYAGYLAGDSPQPVRAGGSPATQSTTSRAMENSPVPTTRPASTTRTRSAASSSCDEDSMGLATILIVLIVAGIVWVRRIGHNADGDDGADDDHWQNWTSTGPSDSTESSGYIVRSGRSDSASRSSGGSGRSSSASRSGGGSGRSSSASRSSGGSGRSSSASRSGGGSGRSSGGGRSGGGGSSRGGGAGRGR